jgi:hypothetical protein
VKAFWVGDPNGKILIETEETPAMKITITEALAEIKTIGKRLSTKREFVGQYLARQEGLKDPLLSEGGSVQVIRETRQSIIDLQTRIIRIRRAISEANASAELTLAGVTRSIAEWLVWRREVAEDQLQFLRNLRSTVNTMRDQAIKKGWAVVSKESDVQSNTDLIVNINELELSKDIEGTERVLGDLDGQLSLKNATTMVEFAD